MKQLIADEKARPGVVSETENSSVEERLDGTDAEGCGR
jgi:hypothetical protein